MSTYVLYSMSYYAHFESGIYNRNYFLMHSLKKKSHTEKIIHIDFLPYSIKSLIRSIKYKYILGKRHKTLYKSFLFSLYQSDSGVYIISSPIYFFSKITFIKKLLCCLHILKITESIALSFNPFDVTFLDKRIFSKSIFDAVDDWRHHAQLQKKRKILEKNYATIKKRADSITVVSKDLVHLLGARSHIVPNGFYIFSKSVEQNNTSSKRIVYMGTIEERFDVELVMFFVRSLKHIQFDFIGPIWRTVEQKIKILKEQNNLNFLGRIPYEKSLRMLTKYHIGIIPHTVSPFSVSNDPMKIYDYISQGLFVVSTIRSQEQEINRIITFTTSKEEFLAALLNYLDTEKIRYTFDFSRYSWDSRLDKILYYAS